MAQQKPLTAAGGVLWRDGSDGPEVLLVHRPGYDDWSLPKGKPDHGENAISTAVREVNEETGLRFRLGARLGSVSYRAGARAKTVTYWAMRLDGDQQGDPAPHNEQEIDDLAWHSVAGARRALTYPQDVRILDAFIERGLAPVSLILVRHALAGKRSDWSGPDSQRPLDQRGLRQASALGVSVAAFSPSALVSAPLERCVQTAAPIAATTSLPIELSPLVSDKALKKDAKHAVKQLKNWVHSGSTRVVVSQGNLIDAALDGLLGETPGGHPRPKGSAWVFCSSGRKIVAADFYSSFLPSGDR